MHIRRLANAMGSYSGLDIEGKRVAPYVRPLLLLLASLVVFEASADIIYKDPNSTGIADFQQQPGRGVCVEVAVSNCLWFFDHHGFPGLIPHSAGDPGDFGADGQKVINDLEVLVRGSKDPNTGERSGGLGSERGVAKYIKDKNQHFVKGKKGGLKVKLYHEPKYSVFQQELARSQDVIPYWKAFDPNGITIKRGDPNNPRDWYHAQTAAGYDPNMPPTEIAMTNGWRNRNGARAENPTVGDPNNYDIGNIQDPNTNGDKLRITSFPGINGIPPLGASYIEMVKMMTICPVDPNGDVRNVETQVIPVPGEPPMAVYDLTLHNLTDNSGQNEPVQTFGYAIDVPFDFFDLNVQSPPGWDAEEWDSLSAPGLISPFPFLDPNDLDALDDFDPEVRGILWFTFSAPVPVGGSLSGFGFELPDTFEIEDDGAYVAIGSSTEEFGMADFGFTAGPTETAIAQNKDQQRCINELNKNFAKVAKAQAKNIVKCIKDGSKGKLTGAIEECITSDPKGKVAKAKQKTISKETQTCPVKPAFAATDAITVNAVAMQKELDLLHAIFGSDFDSTIILQSEEPSACQCQSFIAKSVTKCQDTKLKEFNKCKKSALKGKGQPAVTRAPDLEDACLGIGANSQPDPKGKIAKACGAKLATSVNGGKCQDVELSRALPGCGTDNPGQAATCLDQLVECKVCQALNQADALNRDCDLFDDGLANGSCP